MAIVTTRDTRVQEVLTPDPDGLQTDFQTSQAYLPNSLSLWVNGVLVVDELDNGFLLPGGTTVTLKVAPLTGDTLEARYDPA